MKSKILIFLILGIAGAGALVGTHALDPLPFFTPEVHRIEKKISAVKPKNFNSDRKNFRKAALDGNENFSFFTVLEDPSMSKMVGLNGEVYKNYRSQPVNAVAVQVLPEKIIAAPPIHIEKREVKKTDQQIEIPKSNPIFPKVEPAEAIKVETVRTVDRELSAFLAYAVQVSSFRQLERAEILKGDLAKKGYASFIGKTELSDNKGTWYRVYLGRYLDRAGAEVAAARVQREENLQAMVIKRQSG
ncbi:MAG: SPOR domain-containing protein [Nitrospinae bacterium]|jgi:cell division septation protein DedD|nr:SPOR domain-containing protein [Nitrospinota bacterium]